MKTSLIATLLVNTIVATGLCAEQPFELSRNELQSGWLKSLRSSTVGYSGTAVKSPFGRYLLFKNDDSVLALKLEKNVPSEYGESMAGEYSFIQYRNTKAFDHEPDNMQVVLEGSFRIDERLVGGERAWIEIGGFKCSWSAGGWIYFHPDYPNLKVALTEATQKDELAISDVEWMTRTSMEKEVKDDGTLNAVLGLINTQEPEDKPSPDKKKKQNKAEMATPRKPSD